MSTGHSYNAAFCGAMFVNVQIDWHTSVRCSLQYHQDSIQWNSEFINIDEYFACGGAYDGSGWSGAYVEYGLGIFLQVVYYNEITVRRGSSHFIYHQYNYGPINHDGLDGQFHISGFTKEGRNIGTWADPITRVGFMSESWALRDSFSIIVGSMHIIYFIMMIIKILEMKDYLLVVILLVLEV